MGATFRDVAGQVATLALPRLPARFQALARPAFARGERVFQYIDFVEFNIKNL